MTIYSFRSLFILLLLCISAFTLKAQDSIAPLSYNPVLDAYIHSHENASTWPKKRSKHGEPHTLFLPFFEDFSKSLLYPNDTVWLDNDVFINNSYGINPPSIGVATFDGINSAGRAYTQNAQNNGTQPTDTLTSTYIDLSPFTDSDSIYLSFFYQPGGLGDSPEAGDSLILQFHPDSMQINGDWDDSAWVRIWSVPGSSLQPFTQVMIPIRKLNSPNFFHNKFQFRFVSMGHRSGNLDNWHVDYIYLNEGRTINDTALEDLAVNKLSGSILKKYYSMPLKQFKADINNNLADKIFIYGKNNSTELKNTAFSYTITNSETEQELQGGPKLQSANLDPFDDNRFELPAELESAGLTNRKTVLLVKTSVFNNPDDYRMNDTATHKQIFDDYMAYDDGSAEGGYGLQGTNIGKAALRFTLNTPDTLHGIGVHFNQSNTYVGGQTITLAVWKRITPVGQAEDDDPEARIQYVKPVYDRINGFTYFPLPSPLFVEDEFYIGWVQNREFFLNVGFDKNYSELQGPKADNLFISVAGRWQKSEVDGVPMLRAYVGSQPVIVGVKENNNFLSNLEAHIFPNPNKGNFTIHFAEQGNYKIQVLDITGKLLTEKIAVSQTENLYLDKIKPGIYLVNIWDKNTGSSIVKRISVL